MSWSERRKITNISGEELNELLLEKEPCFVLNCIGNQPSVIDGQEFKFSELIGWGQQSYITGHTVADLKKLEQWLNNTNDLVLGYFSYDLKNALENLTSKNEDVLQFAPFYFVVPQAVFFRDGDQVIGFSHHPVAKTRVEHRKQKIAALGKFSSITKERYQAKVERLKQYIQLGDIYEVNFCVQHQLEQTTLAPFRLYQELRAVSPAPFSCYVVHNKKYLMSSSPERFMLKMGNRIVSQPMKGTNRRCAHDNEAQKAALKNDLKERAENVMITDLVRNDLSRSAKKGSVKVDELCGVYEFEHVNQMISTVSAQLRENVHPLTALISAFPMGSMTGAPKIRAMELIDEEEDFSRGLYAGSVGYFTPELNFDFNVIIRSVLYNEERKMVTFPTGSAITINSDPEKEYEECMLKAEAMQQVLRNHAQ